MSKSVNEVDATRRSDSRRKGEGKVGKVGVRRRDRWRGEGEKKGIIQGKKSVMTPF